ncbi:cell division protein FtsH, partial [Aduncisulcus paluster]
AYHEAGHAIVGLNVPAGIPVHKATIIPRGRAMGMVKFLPEGDRYSMKYKEFTSQLAVAMGGRVAEEITFGKDNITSGASSDIQQATKMAKAMVTQLGYSDQLATAQKIDAEVRRLVEEGYETARRILTEKKVDFETLAKALLEFETLSGDEIKDLLNGKKPSRESVLEPIGPRASAVPPAGKPRPRPDPDTGMEPQPQA